MWTKGWFRPSSHPGLIWIFAEGNFMEMRMAKVVTSYEIKVEQRPEIVSSAVDL